MSDTTKRFSAVEFLRGVRHSESYELAYLWHCVGPFVIKMEPDPLKPCTPRNPHPGWQNTYPCNWRLRAVVRSLFPEDDPIDQAAARTVVW